MINSYDMYPGNDYSFTSIKQIDIGGGDVMKCPYCQKEMLRGYIPNGSQPVQWIPDGEGPSLLSFSVAGTGSSPG